MPFFKSCHVWLKTIFLTFILSVYMWMICVKAVSKDAWGAQRTALSECKLYSVNLQSAGAGVWTETVDMLNSISSLFYAITTLRHKGHYIHKLLVFWLHMKQQCIILKVLLNLKEETEKKQMWSLIHTY